MSDDATPTHGTPTGRPVPGLMHAIEGSNPPGLRAASPGLRIIPPGKQAPPVVSDRVKDDLRFMLGGPAGFVRLTIVQTKHPLLLRADMIDAYAPLGDGNMEVFRANHVWKVSQHFEALSKVLAMDALAIIDALLEPGEEKPGVARSSAKADYHLNALRHLLRGAQK